MRLTMIIAVLIAALSAAAAFAQQDAQAPAQQGADKTERKDQDIRAAEEAAQKAAESWLSLVDAGKYAEAWDQASDGLKAIADKERLATSLRTARSAVGTLKARKLNSARYTKELNNAPPGEYVVLKYECSFENKENAMETIVPTLDKDGKWRVSGYFVK